MKTTTLELIDEVNVRFHGLDGPTIRKCYDEMKFFLHHARYTPAYKLGRWDGYVSYFTNSGQTYFNLLDKILPIVIAAGYDVTIDDKRSVRNLELKPITESYFAALGKAWPKGHPLAGEPIVLRDYQIDAINGFLENQQSLQSISTGAGKTIITAALSAIVEEHGNSLVIVPSKNLVVQTEKDYLNLGLDVGVYFGERKELGHKHTISTWQSLNNLVKDGRGLDEEDKPIRQITDNLVAVMVDEAHAAKGNELRNMLSTALADVPIRWGLTGTIPKEQELFYAILGTIGPVVNKLEAKTLQDQGFLSNCNIIMTQTQETNAFPDYQSELKYLVTDNDRLNWIADSIRNVSTSGNTLVLISRIETGEALQTLLKEKGIDAALINGSVKLKDRTKEYDEVQTVDNKVIIASYGVAAVGIDIPRIFNLMLIEPGKSFVRVIQSIGRGIRKAKDKDFVNIWDVCSNLKYSKKHMAARKDFYKEAQYPFQVVKVNIDTDDITKGK